jgi:hypothetical protein
MDRKNLTPEEKERFKQQTIDIIPLADAFVQWQINARNPFAESISRDQIKYAVAEFYMEMICFGIDDMNERYKPKSRT